VRQASVLVPTHDAATTLDLAVASALAQTEVDLEVVIVGDGVTPEVRRLAQDLAAADPRVRFLDLPKGAHHGEAHRDRIVREELDAPIVCYLCDDDLLLPEHVSSMVGLLQDADLANAMNGHMTVDGRFFPYFSDLGSPEHRAWLAHPQRNSVSVTGTAHTVAAYRRLAVGWEPPPPGRWTDHLLWQKLLALPGLRAVTSAHVTALQFPTHLEGRDVWSPAQRRDELQRWWERMDDQAGRNVVEDIIRTGLNTQGAVLQVALDTRVDGLADELVDATDAIADRDAELDVLRAREGELAHELQLVLGSRTWRLRRLVVRGPLRRLVRR
jgi:hypothetical protein